MTGPVAALVAIAATVSLAVAAAARDVLLPAYAPELGQQITWLSTTEVSVENRGTSPVTRSKGYGAFLKRMTVTGRNPDMLTAVWRFDAERPRRPALPEGNYFLNDHYSRALQLWGIDQLTIETDLGGYPLRVPDLTRLRAEMLSKVAQMLQGAAVQEGTVLAQAITQLDADPLFLAEALIPEAFLVARAQRSSTAARQVGSSGTTEETFRIAGKDVIERTAWTLEAFDKDRGTLTIAWKGEHDPVALALAQNDAIAKAIEAIRAQSGAISDVQLAELRLVSKTRHGRAVIAIRDGATIEAQETAQNVLAGLRVTQTMRVSRAER